MIIKWIKSVIEANKQTWQERMDELEGVHRQRDDDNCFAYAIGNCLNLTRAQIEMIESVNKDRGFKPNDVDGLLNATISLGFAGGVSMDTKLGSVPCVAVVKNGKLIADDMGGVVIGASKGTHAFAIMKHDSADQYEVEDGNLGKCWLWKYSVRRWESKRLIRFYTFR